MSYVNYEGLPDVEALASIMLDASASMRLNELQTNEPKHRRVAWMVQEILNAMDDPQYEFASIAVACFSAAGDGVKVLPLLEEHNPYELKTYTGSPEYDYWDALCPANRQQGMGHLTPIGAAISWARTRAEQWVNASLGQVQRRAVIYLLSDGMNNVGPDGMEEKTAIAAFNATCEKGDIRLATIGYFQSPPGTDREEDEGRQLLRALPLNTAAYFEAADVTKIVSYILSTITLATSQAA